MEYSTVLHFGISVLLSVKVSRKILFSVYNVVKKKNDKNARQKGSLRSASIKSISVSKNTARSWAEHQWSDLIQLAVD